MSKILEIFAVKDSKADSFITPFFLPNKEMAIRTFGMTCSDKNHTFGSYPEDFHLYYLGKIDTQNCKFETIPPELLITGIDSFKNFQREYNTQNTSNINND